MPAPKFVLIRGMVKKPELNGKYGFVVGGIDDGQYPVQVRDPQSNDLKTFKVKSENTTAVTLAELCKGLPHPLEIYNAQVAASSLQTFKPRLTAIHDRLESLPQDEGQFRDVKDLALCVELGLAKFASLSSAGFPAARVEELRDYFCRRVAEVTPQTSYLNDLAVLFDGSDLRCWHECCYFCCYTFATGYLIQYHHEKNGAFEKIDKLCEQWLTYEEQRVAAGAERDLGILSDFIATQARALHGLGKYEDAITRWGEVRRMVMQEEAGILAAARTAQPATEMEQLDVAQCRASVEFNLASARLSANKITRAEHEKTLEEVKKYCPKNTGTYRNILCWLQENGRKLNPAESGQACRDTTCAICLEPLELAQGVAVLPCFHGFHKDCHVSYIVKLMKDAKKAAEEGTVPTNRAYCPTCRAEGWNTASGREFQNRLNMCRDVALGRIPIPARISR